VPVITDTRTQELVRQSSSSQLGGGFVLMAVGGALIVLSTLVQPDDGPRSLLLVLGVCACVAGAILVAAALVRLTEKFEDVHRMTAATHQARVSEEIRVLRERSS
jgi:hypothetical protein